MSDFLMEFKEILKDPITSSDLIIKPDHQTRLTWSSAENLKSL